MILSLFLCKFAVEPGTQEIASANATGWSADVGGPLVQLVQLLSLQSCVFLDLCMNDGMIMMIDH